MRSALWAVMGVVALFSMSCAGGADEIGDAGSGQAAVCNNGILETNLGEECEPSIVDPNMTCQAMGMPAGTMVCMPDCTILNMCMDPNSMQGGGGNGSAGGGGMGSSSVGGASG